jgi:hypothetical protein
MLSAARSGANRSASGELSSKPHDVHQAAASQ